MGAASAYVFQVTDNGDSATLLLRIHRGSLTRRPATKNDNIKVLFLHMSQSFRYLVSLLNFRAFILGCLVTLTFLWLAATNFAFIQPTYIIHAAAGTLHRLAAK